MAKGAVPEVVLSSGHKMPLIGLGTAGQLPPPDVLTSIFVDAIEIGYRHFDTAAVYGSEESLGRAVEEALRRGLIKSRDELFITSKLSMADTHPDLVLPAINNTLRKLGLDYVDLYLIHSPVRLRKNPSPPTYEIPKEDFLPFDIEGTWKAMEECSKLGLAKSIGVSNFGSKKLSILLENATIPPAVNQVETNVAWQQDKLREYCKGEGIHVSAWSPLGSNGARWGSLQVMESSIVKEIAQSRQKSIAQVALRWIYEQGASVIVKSYNKERMKENLQIFAWELSKDEAQKIKDKIPQRRGFSGEMFVHEDGPYKSLDELWA